MSNEQLSKRMLEMEMKMGIEHVHSVRAQGEITGTCFGISKQNLPVHKHHSRVKSDQIQNQFRLQEELPTPNPSSNRHAKVAFHGGSQSISFHQIGPTSEGHKSLVHRFLENVAQEEIIQDNQEASNFLKFDNLMRENKQNQIYPSHSNSQNFKVPNSNAKNQYFQNYNHHPNSPTQLNGGFNDDPQSKHKRAKKSTGSQKSAIIYNQNTVNSVNSANFIQTYTNQPLQIKTFSLVKPSPTSLDLQKQSKLKTNHNSINPISLHLSGSQTHMNQMISKSSPLSPKLEISLTAPTSDTSNENQMVTGKKMWTPKCTLRSHLDGVRGLFFTAVDPILVTASEDCLLKLWDTRELREQNESSFVQPYCTLRGHESQILCVTGNQQQIDSNINYQSYNFIFSAGTDGIIKAWNLPLPDEVEQVGCSDRKTTKIMPNSNVGEWKAHHEAIWDINHHPLLPILLSAGADCQIRLWRTFSQLDGTNLISLQQGELISKLSYQPGQFMDIPTSVAWDHQRNSIVTGWVSNTHIVTFSTETNKINNVIKYSQDHSQLSSQVNKIICHEGINCAISGHEDKQIRFFDLKSNTLVKNLIGHTDAVTSLSLHPNQFYMSSVGHDGSMRTWDIRKYQCVHDIPVHKRKYDESVHVVMYHPKLPLIATGGADGLVKIFHQQDMIQ